MLLQWGSCSVFCRRVNSNARWRRERTRRVDVRNIAATNRESEARGGSGAIPERDLYFRLSVFPLETPTLRSRREDIPILAAHFLKQAATRSNFSLPRLTRTNIQELTDYSWPGNIRELQNVIERAVILSKGGALHFENCEEASTISPQQDISVPATQKQWLESQRANIKAALAQTGGRIYGKGGAAELLGLRPTTLSSRIAALRN